MKRAVSVLLAVLLIFTAIPFAASAVDVSASNGKLIILHTNDVHGRDKYVEGSSIGRAGVAKIKQTYEAAGAEVLLLSAGDDIQGAPLVNVSQGETAIEFMNAAKYDAMTIGNHEYDYPASQLTKLEGEMDFPLLSANILSKSDGSNAYTPYRVFTMKSGRKVGVFGLTTPETMTKTHPDNVKDVTFIDGEALYDLAQKQIDALKAEGCTFIIALGHLGTDVMSSPNRSTDVIANTTGIDLFVDGHSHTEFKNGMKVGNTLLVSTGEYLNNVGVVTYDGTSLSAALISDDSFGRDEAVDKLINDAYDEIQAEYSAVFATTTVNLNGTREGGDVTSSDGTVIASFPEGEGNRTAETNLGDFSADAQLYAAEKVTGEDIDVSIVNGGNVRETIPAGPITRNDMITVFPFQNTVVVLKLTGGELLEALEAACYAMPDSLGAFPQVAGVEFDVDGSVPYEKGTRYPDSTYYAPKLPGSRVKNVMIGGAPLDLKAEYTLTTNDFLAAGGDTYHALKAPFERNGNNTGYGLEESLIDYIKNALGGVIGAQYEQPQGRITLINPPVNTMSKFTDVQLSQWYFAAVSYVVFNGVMQGTAPDKFTPAGTTTRAQFYQTLYNLEGAPEQTEPSSFADVPAAAWYAQAVAWAQNNELTDGVGNNLFEPNRQITRQEIAKAMDAYLEVFTGLVIDTSGTDLSKFSDEESISSWALEGMEALVELGLLNGSAGKLNPKGDATRAELSQIMYNYSKVA